MKLTNLHRIFRAALIAAVIFLVLSGGQPRAAEIYIDRTGTRQLNFLNLTDGSMNDLRNDPIGDFNWYVSRWDAKNPLEWTHIWSLAQPSDGNIALDGDENFTVAIAAELFPVIWDIDYPISTEDDRVYWDTVPYGGPTGGAFDPLANAGAMYVARVEGNNSYWGAKRISLNPALIPQNQLQYFWLQIDNDPLMPNWFTSIDYSDLAIIFNAGNLAISKTASVVSGFDPPRVGYTTVYRVRIDVSNPTITSTGGPMYDVKVTDKFPAGSSIVTSPSLGSVTIDGAGNLVWDVGILQDGALNNPAAAGSKDFLEVLVSITPTGANVGTPILLNAGATITGGQTPLDPGDGTGNLYPFNFHGTMADKITGVSVTVATANVVPANTGTISTTAQIYPGETISVTVDDSDLNLNAAAIETVAISLTNQSTGETETITCVETGVNTGVFTANLATAFGLLAGANNNATINVKANDIVRATYNDAVAPNGLPAVVTADTNSLGGTTGTITSTTPILPGATITITLTDADLNTDPLSAQSFIITTTNMRTGETESLTYTETGINTGAFSATVNTAAAAPAGANNTGSFNCISGDVIRTTYNDARIANGGTASPVANTSVLDLTNFVTITSPKGSHANTTHNVIGTTDPSSTLTMLDPITNAILTTTADIAGNYSFANVVFPQGITAYTVTSTDPSGNTAVEAATVLIDTNNFITLTGPLPNSTINTATSNVTGLTDPGSTVTIVEPGTNLVLTVVADAAGVFTFTNVAFIPGNNAIAVTSTDPLGNIANTNFNFIVDPTIQLSINSISEGNTYSSTSVLIAGVTDPFSTVTTTNPVTGIVVTTVADAAGNYSFGNFTFAPGPHNVVVNATDPVGNTATTNVNFSIDSTNTNDIITTGTFTISTVDIQGTTDPFSTVTMPHPVNGLILTTVADAAGNYVFNDVFFPDGSYNFTTTSSDQNGNTAVDSSSLTVDSTISLSVFLPPDRSVINTPTLDMTGTTDPFSTVTMVDPATDVKMTTIADAQGNFVFQNVNLNEGENTVQFTAVDPVGNTILHNHTLIYNPNVTLYVETPANGDVVHDSTQTVSGTTTPGATVAMNDPSTGAIITVVADAQGNFSFGPVNFTDGTNTVTVTATAPNGRSTTTSNTFVVAETGEDGVLTVSERVVFGNPIYLEVRDPETYLSATAIETITVLVTNPSTGDSEQRTLIETSANSGVFTGLINTVESAASDGANSGKLAVLYGQTVTTSYIDKIRADGSLDVTLTANTLVTNDEIRINVNITDISGNTSVEPLANAEIAILAYSGAALTGGVYNYVTNSTGDVPSDFVGRMRTGERYVVLLDESFNGYPYSHSREFTIDDVRNTAQDARGVRTFVITLDPAGYVYDAITGARIAGADVTLFHSTGAPVAGPFSIYTNNPASTQTNPQLSGDSGISGGFEFIGSGAGSDLTAGFYYITVSFNTTPALAALYSPISLSSASWAGIKEPYTGQLFLVDLQNQPIGMRVPLTPRNAPTPFYIDKKADRQTASPGGVVTFTVNVKNLSNSSTDPSNPVTVKDTIPPGFTYIKGSATLTSGVPVSAWQSGQEVFFPLGVMQPAGDPGGRDTFTVMYQAAVDTSAQPGLILTNTAVAMINMFTLSGTAAASVKIVPDPILDEATLIGTVFHDANANGVMDNNEEGIKNAGVLLDDGAYVLTGDFGKYSAPGLRPGPKPFGGRAVKLDMTSLPAGAKPTTPESLFVTLTPGGIDKAVFGVSLPAGKLDAPARKKLYLLSFDTSVGELVSSSPDQLRADGEFLRDGTNPVSRVAYFFTGDISNGYKLTTSYDSGKRHSTGIFTDKNREDYYPTYGDNSAVKNLADTQGRFYMNLKTPSAKLIAGNYRLALKGTSLAPAYRAMYGAMFDYINKGNTADKKKPVTEAAIFASGHKQMHARSELRSTGGTRYNLAHNDIAPGSEVITVQVRDSFIPERILSSRTLTKGIDYEIYYPTGRIRLFEPAAINTESEYLFNDDIGSGNPVWIVAEYIYSPESKGFGTFGARVRRITAAGFAIGATHIRENLDSRDHQLDGVDFSWTPDGEELCRVEWAHSESGGVPWLLSLDGGSSYLRQGGENSRSGSAIKADITITSINNVEWRNYWYYAGANFNGGSFGERGIKRGGTSAKYTNASETWRFDYTESASLSGASEFAVLNAGGEMHSLRLGYRRDFVKKSVEAEFIHRRSTSLAQYGLFGGTTDGVALRLEKVMTERIRLYLRQQVTLSPRNAHQTSIGVKYKMGEKNQFDAEATYGTNGGGGKAGFERTASDGKKLYLNTSSGYSFETGGDVTNTTAGASSPIGKHASARIERSAIGRNGESASRNTLGLDHSYRMGEHGDISFSLERSREQSSLNGSYYTNDFSVSGGYTTPKKVKVRASSEFGLTGGSSPKSRFAFNFTAEGKYKKPLSISAEYSYNVNEDRKLHKSESKYTRAILGLAYRPPRSDKLNFLARAGRAREYRSLAANQTNQPDTVLTVFSLEGIYDFKKRFSLNEKFASKQYRVRISPLPDARTHTTLWINALTWRPSRKFDFRAEYRTMHQPTQLNHSDGFAVESGFTVKQKVRIGAGYNFSSFSDDEFSTDSRSYRGMFLRLQGKF